MPAIGNVRQIVPLSSLAVQDPSTASMCKADAYTPKFCPAAVGETEIQSYSRHPCGRKHLALLQTTPHLYATWIQIWIKMCPVRVNMLNTVIHLIHIIVFHQKWRFYMYMDNYSNWSALYLAILQATKLHVHVLMCIVSSHTLPKEGRGASCHVWLYQIHVWLVTHSSFL